MDGELGFELPDAPPRGRQLSPLCGREAVLDPLIHPLLSSPAIHRLFADAKVHRDVAHTSACADQVKDSLPKLRRITPSAHAVLLVGQQRASPVSRLHETQDSPLRGDGDGEGLGRWLVTPLIPAWMSRDSKGVHHACSSRHSNHFRTKALQVEFSAHREISTGLGDQGSQVRVLSPRAFANSSRNTERRHRAGPWAISTSLQAVRRVPPRAPVIAATGKGACRVLGNCAQTGRLRGRRGGPPCW
jgi:hypothetical protein